MTCKN